MTRNPAFADGVQPGMNITRIAAALAVVALLATACGSAGENSEPDDFPVLEPGPTGELGGVGVVATAEAWRDRMPRIGGPGRCTDLCAQITLRWDAEVPVGSEVLLVSAWVGGTETILDDVDVRAEEPGVLVIAVGQGPPVPDGGTVDLTVELVSAVDQRLTLVLRDVPVMTVQ